MKKVFLLLISTCIFSSVYSGTSMCMYCNGTGQVPQVVGCDMFLNPIYGWAVCPACGGAGSITINPMPMPMPMPIVTPMPTPTPTDGGESSSSRNGTSSHRCPKCHGSGWYTCPCSSAPTFGNESYHTCDNCGKSHQRGYHSCKCNYCGGKGYL